ncbi:MAG: galactitol-1-phosphate 5-dehydrogenase [Butyrivibrio sp.]|nr:galactitol-1-phosphate 5-dehydrogenase [Butyrivibrio sp.]
MKAQILYGIGNIKLTEIERPAPRVGEALIKVSSCGICGSDIPRVYKSGAHNMPLIPGHEFAGTIVGYDSKQDTASDDLSGSSNSEAKVVRCGNPILSTGKRVGIFPLIPCMKCPQCKSLHYEMCENYNYLGSRRDGGFAEYVSVPVWNLLPLPDEVTDEEAAMLEPMAVAVHAMRRALGAEPVRSFLNEANCTNDDTDVSSSGAEPISFDFDSSIVVCGLGTIGLLMALFLKDAGFTNVLCIGNKDIQKKKLLEMGYSESCFCDVRYGNPVAFINEKTAGRGADCYFECIGRSESYEQAVKCTAPLGTVMLVGNPASDMELSKDTYWKILRNQLTILGTWNSSYYGPVDETMPATVAPQSTNTCTDTSSYILNPMDDWQYVLSRLTAWKQLSNGLDQPHFSPADLITHRFGLDELDNGLDIMHRKSEEYVKILVKI